MIRRSQRVLYAFAGIATVLGLGLVLGADGNIGAWVGASLSLAFGALMAWIGWQAPNKNPVMRALVKGQPKLTQVTLFPAAHVDGPAEKAAEILRQLPYSVVFALDDETVPGEYQLPRDEAAAFLTQLEALDPDIVIEASDAKGERYRLTRIDDLR